MLQYTSETNDSLVK